MSLSEGDIAFAQELFSDLPDLTIRRMFGGVAFYSEGTLFGLLRSDGAVLLKARQGPFADHLAGQGCTLWEYERKSGARATMPYWALPADMLDDPDRIRELAFQAIAAERQAS